MGVLIEWVNRRGFVNSDYIVSAKCHIDEGQIKLYARDVTGHENLIKDPSDTSELQFRLDWEKEGRRQLEALMKVMQGEEPHAEAPETKKTVVRKAK